MVDSSSSADEAWAGSTADTEAAAPKVGDEARRTEKRKKNRREMNIVVDVERVPRSSDDEKIEDGVRMRF
jgi:hypothetical protein